MRDQLDAAAHEPTDAGFAATILMLQCGHAQIKNFRSIHLSGDQSFFRLVKADGCAKFRLAQFTSFATISNESVPLV